MTTPPEMIEASALCVLRSNAPSSHARAIAETLVAERLAACVNLSSPMESVYRWEGAIEREEEIALTIKCSNEARSACIARLVALHPHDVPEVLEMALKSALKPYSHWVVAQSVQGLAGEP